MGVDAPDAAQFFGAMCVQRAERRREFRHTVGKRGWQVLKSFGIAERVTQGAIRDSRGFPLSVDKRYVSYMVPLEYPGLREPRTIGVAATRGKILLPGIPRIVTPSHVEGISVMLGDAGGDVKREVSLTYVDYGDSKPFVHGRKVHTNITAVGNLARFEPALALAEWVADDARGAAPPLPSRFR